MVNYYVILSVVIILTINIFDVTIWRKVISSMLSTTVYCLPFHSMVFCVALTRGKEQGPSHSRKSYYNRLMS